MQCDLARVSGSGLSIEVCSMLDGDMENGFILKIHRSMTSAANKNDDDVGEPKRPP